MKPILEITNISKRFYLDHQNAPYLNFRDRLTDIFKKKNKKEEFWALKDIQFDVEQGESLGIIGRNGAGKSTLLKILSRITPPTTGKIVSRGRIASLLEVGTGFHQELTGRENIYMNGSILGMRKWQIDKRFDEIVDFSGTEKFLDTPLKHYSSGMQLRLAFAVAAHLDPEILIIDEVLAVGDAEFQKKCMGKMEDVSRGGRTLLFVSHNLFAVEHLCKNSLLIDNGRVCAIGKSKKVIQNYLETMNKDTNHQNGYFDLRNNPTKRNKERGFLSAQLYCDDFKTNLFRCESNFKLELDFSDTIPINDLVVGFVIKDSTQKPIIGINNWDLGLRLNTKPLIDGKVTFEIAKLPIYGQDGFYVDLYFGDGGDNYDIIENGVAFNLEPNDILKMGRILNPALNTMHPGKVDIRIS